jgi:hypothetical protein
MVATRLMEGSFQKPATSGGPTSRAAAGSAPLPLAFQERDFPAQRQMAQNRLQAEKRLRRDKNAYVKARQLRAFG